MIRFRPGTKLTLSSVIVAIALAIGPLAGFAQRDAQHDDEQEKPKSEKTRTEKLKAEKPPKPLKADVLTLRYKPQVGTLIYNVKTEVSQHVIDAEQEFNGLLTSTAQLVFHNVAIDYSKKLWSFDRYFTKFLIYGRQLTGDSLSLQEHEAVDKITRLTYKMTGEEIENTVIDSLKLLNTEAQTLYYFFAPPRMLIPLPEKAVTYGDSWQDHSVDTIFVRDTINIGITTGSYTYDVHRTYRLSKLLDTMGNYLAVIVATDTGFFQGRQTNSLTNIENVARGPLSGTDTTFLDLFSGRVLLRTTNLRIPAAVEVTGAAQFTDILEVRKVIVLDESNALKLKPQ